MKQKEKPLTNLKGNLAGVSGLLPAPMVPLSTHCKNSATQRTGSRGFVVLLNRQYVSHSPHFSRHPGLVCRLSIFRPRGVCMQPPRQRQQSGPIPMRCPRLVASRLACTCRLPIIIICIYFSSLVLLSTYTAPSHPRSWMVSSVDHHLYYSSSWPLSMFLHMLPVELTRNLDQSFVLLSGLGPVLRGR